MTKQMKIIFDKLEWENRIDFYNNLYSAINNIEHSSTTKDTIAEYIRKDPRLVYHDYRMRNPRPTGYYRKRLEQFLADSDSDSEDEANAEPNKYLFKIEQEFVRDMKRRLCEAAGICWAYTDIRCPYSNCPKKHILFEPTQKQMMDYFDLFL
jgi:hypothetical protein